MAVIVKGIRKINNLLRKVQVKVVNQATPLKQAGVLLLNEIDGYFQQGGNPSQGGKWKMIKELTIARKGSSRVLIDTGVLRGSFRQDITGNTLRIGTQVKYAKYHEEGDGVPKRPMLPSTAKVVEVIDKQYTNYIAKLIK